MSCFRVFYFHEHGRDQARSSGFFIGRRDVLVSPTVSVLAAGGEVRSCGGAARGGGGAAARGHLPYWGAVREKERQCAATCRIRESSRKP